MTPSSADSPTAEGGASDAESVVIGRLQSPHGVRGWLHFRSFTEDPGLALSLKPWFLENPTGALTPVEVEAHRSQGENFLVKLRGVDDRNAAALRTGKPVRVPLSVLPPPPPDEFYWHDLEGMAVVNTQGDDLGQVDSVFDNGAHAVLVVRADSRERLIPFVPAYIQEVDLAGRILRVDWEKDWD